MGGIAQFLDQTFVGKPGLIDGVASRPARPVDVITIYGIGFGPVSPFTAAGTIASGNTALQSQPTFRLGGVPATLSYAGLAPNAVGLYQFNLVVPNSVSGDVPLTVETGGTIVNQSLFLTIGPIDAEGARIGVTPLQCLAHRCVIYWARNPQGGLP